MNTRIDPPVERRHVTNGDRQASHVGVRGARGRRLLFATSIAAAGLAVTLVMWASILKETETRAAQSISLVARDIHAVLNVRVEQHMRGLQNLAMFWQLHGLLPQPAWEFDTRFAITNLGGVEWIAWVNGRSGNVRFVAVDSTVRPDPEILQSARLRANEPGMELPSETWASNSLLYVAPVRTPDDSVGVLVSAMSPARLLGKEMLTSGEILAYTVRSDSGVVVYRAGTEPARIPPGMTTELNLPPVFGRMWTVRYVPTADFLNTAVSRWPNFFLLTGALLSLALASTAFQYAKLREVSATLSAANVRLDAQLVEVSKRDHSLRKLNDELEVRVESRTSELVEAVSELEAFSHSISHDLRSPISAMLNLAVILEEDYGDRLDEEGIRLLRRVREGGESASSLLDQLVQFVWVGRDEGERTDINMTDLAREAYAEVVVGHEDAREVQFELHELPPAQGNPALLGRVFRNLFSNAVKYTRGRSPRIIQVVGESHPNELVYRITDNGVGFDPESAEAVFEPFRRLHAGSEYDGAGLGLAIVSKIVRKHGGRVWAKSEGTGGAQFGFTLPNGDHA